MIPYQGDFPEDATVLIPFNTFSSDDPSASVTITNLADGDLKVHKDGSTTEIVTDGATIAIDFDGVTGNHMATIDTSAHADYATGSDYHVRMEGTTVDGATINAWIGSFSIENRYPGITAGSILTDTETIISDTEQLGTATDTDIATDIANLQASVDGIGSGGGSALNYGVSADNTGGAIFDSVTFVGTQTGTFANTQGNSGTYHTIDDDSNAFDIVYRIPVGATKTAINVTWTGYLNGGNDECSLQVYDHDGTAWETLETISGKSGSTNDEIVVPLLDKHTPDVGDSEAGNVYVRFVCSGQSNPQLNTARLVASAVTATSTMGYEEGQVWVDEDNGTSSGTTLGVDGTFANQSDDFDNAQDIADALGTSRLHLHPGNSITLTDSLSGYVVHNQKATLDGGSQDVSDSEFTDGTITGDWNQTTGFPRYNNVRFFGPSTPVSLPQFVAFGSSVVGTLQLTEAANQSLIDCNAGGTPTIDCNSLGSGLVLNLVRCTGNFTFSNLASGAVVNINHVGGGDIVLNGADATVNIDGEVSTVTNNLTGSPTVTDNSKTLANINAEADTAITDAGIVADTEAILSDAELVLADSESILADTNELQTDWADGGRLDLIADAILADTETGITERATLLADTEAIFSDTEATLIDTAAILSDTEGAITERTALLADTEAVLSDVEAILVDTNELQTDWTDGGRLDLIADAILSDTEGLSAGSGLTPLASGTAQGGTASTIQLAAGETFADSELNGNVVKITSGTGAGQSRVITAYTGSTDTATVSPNWITNPSSDSVYEVVNGSVNIDTVVLTTQTAGDIVADTEAILSDTEGLGAGSGLTALATGTAQGGTSSTIQLASGETFADDELNGNVVKCTGGTGAGQSRLITAYTGATDTATVSPNWTTTPSSDTTYEVVDGAANVVAVGLTLQTAGDIVADTEAILADSEAVFSDAELILADTETGITERATLLADTEAVLADTNELQTDWTDGGRLDLIVDAVLADTEASQTAETSILSDAESILSDAELILADSESILADTNELQTDWTDAGRLDAILDAVLVDTEAAIVDTTAILSDAESILADTNELQTDWTDAGRLDAILDAALVDTEAAVVDTEAIILDTTAILSDAEAILADTNELQGDWVNGGRLDLIVDAIKAATDLLNTAQTEPTGVPAANETPLVKMAYLFMALRNKVTVTSSKKQFYDDGEAVEWEKDLTDDGTTYTESEGNAP